MILRCMLVFVTAMIATSFACADIPGPGPRPVRPLFVPIPEAAKVTLRVVRDPNATTARLVLPPDADAKRADARRTGLSPSGVFLGLAFAGALVAGGLWLARVPRAKYLAGLMIPLLAAAVIDAIHAQPPRLEAPRPVVESAKVTVSRGAAGQIELVLPPSKR
jgi:hypothetical protein